MPTPEQIKVQELLNSTPTTVKARFGMAHCQKLAWSLVKSNQTGEYLKILTTPKQEVKKQVLNALPVQLRSILDLEYVDTLLEALVEEGELPPHQILQSYAQNQLALQQKNSALQANGLKLLQAQSGKTVAQQALISQAVTQTDPHYMGHDEGTIVIGYFKTKSITGQRTFNNSKEIEFLGHLEQWAKVNPSTAIQVSSTDYKGDALCRCCQRSNGSREYTVRISKDLKVLIPIGYAHNLSHGIPVDPKLTLLQQVMRENGISWGKQSNAPTVD